MKLYIYEHCPFCVRARMIFGLKALPVTLSVIMEGDAETPTRLTGRKAVPILEKLDGTHMGESLDIVNYVDQLADPILVAEPEAAMDAWGKDAWPLGLKLFIPRFVNGDFAEISTPESRQAYREREEKAFGDLELLVEQTPVHLAEMNGKLKELAPLLADRNVVTISDITLFPVLRSLTIVKGLELPAAVRRYVDRLEADSGVPLLFSQAV